jgi:hypothetical protein
MVSAPDPLLPSLVVARRSQLALRLCLQLLPSGLPPLRFGQRSPLLPFLRASIGARLSSLLCAAARTAWRGGVAGTHPQ